MFRSTDLINPKGFCKAVILCTFSVLSAAAISAPIPTCTELNPDPDEDGFGIENGQACQIAAPEITNPETGLPANLKRAYWLPEDVEGERSFICSYNIYDDSSGVPVWIPINTQVRTLNSTSFICGGPPCVPETAEEIEGTAYNPDSGNRAPYTVENGIFSVWNFLWQDADYVPEANSQGLQVWLDNGDRWSCSGAAPSGSVPELPDETSACIDTDPVGDGWGWDGVTSCEIAGTTPEPTVCVDTDPVGDGWGWDGVSSCKIDDASDSETGECIDSDGDGWGWNGNDSCQVELLLNDGTATSATCVDSDGDGWGWDGTDSCKVSTVSESCVDSDGDGWGWDGSNTCLVD